MEDPGTDLKDALEKELREHGVRAPFGLKSKFEQAALDVKRIVRGARIAAAKCLWPDDTGAGRMTVPIGCVAIGTFDSKSFSQEELPILTGTVRIYQPAVPQKLFITEIVEATYSNGEDGELKGYEEVPQAADIVLTSAFIGVRNVMPTAPHQGFGVSGRFLNQSSMNWPVIKAGTDLCLCFAIEPSVLSRAKPRNLPTFYDPVPRTVTVKIRANLEGISPGPWLK